MNPFQAVFQAAGLIPANQFVLGAMTFAEKLATISDPANWQRFVRRTGPADFWTVEVNGLQIEVRALSEKLFVATFPMGGKPWTATAWISSGRVQFDRHIPGYRKVAEVLVDGLAELLLPVWHPDDVGPGGDGTENPLTNGRRAHWRRLSEDWWVQHSFPPDELIRLGVPEAKEGFTFVHEVQP